MKVVPLIVFGAGIGVILGIAIRATIEFRRADSELADLGRERAVLQRQIAQAEEQWRAASTPAQTRRPAPSASGPKSSEAEGVLHASSAAASISGPPASGRQAENSYAAVLNDPARKAAYVVDYRASLDLSNGGVFKALGLSPELIEKFKDKKVEDQLGWLEFRATADRHGLDWDSDGRDALRRGEIKLNGVNLAKLFGPQLTARWNRHRESQNVRDLVQRVASTGAYLEESMTSAQVETTTDTLIANARARDPRNAFRGWQINWEAARAQLEGALSPPQVAALQLFVQEQEADYLVAQRITQLTAQFKTQHPTP